jgi:hypothetical protein
MARPDRKPRRRLFSSPRFRTKLGYLLALIGGTAILVHGATTLLPESGAWRVIWISLLTFILLINAYRLLSPGPASPPNEQDEPPDRADT